MIPQPLTRVYRDGEDVAHLREDVAPAELILCRHYDDQGDPLPGYPVSYDAELGWMGTGSQDEYDRAAALPLCPECAERSS